MMERQLLMMAVTQKELKMLWGKGSEMSPSLTILRDRRIPWQVNLTLQILPLAVDMQP